MKCLAAALAISGGMSIIGAISHLRQTGELGASIVAAALGACQVAGAAVLWSQP